MFRYTNVLVLATTLALLSSVTTAPVRAQVTGVGFQFWSQSQPGINDDAEEGDLFGRSLLVGDFNCDGIDDLAIGVPSEDVGFDCGGDDPDVCEGAGAVTVIYGSPQGLHASAGESDQLLWQATSGVPGNPEEYDHFGEVLALYRGNGCGDDLLVGVPDEDIGSARNAGAVYAFRSTTSGLVAAGVIEQGLDGVPDTPEENDRFGAAIVQAPDGGDESDTNCPVGTQARTIAIGAPGELFNPLATHQQGLVTFVRDPCVQGAANNDLPSPYRCDFGTSAPCTDLAQFESPFGGFSFGGSESGDEFGAALASVALASSPAGYDFLLAVSAPGEDIAGVDGAGVVHIGNTAWWGGTFGVGELEEDEGFGKVLATGDFDGNGIGDLVVGSPSSVADDADGEGQVTVFYIGDSGASEDLDQDSNGVDGAPELGDNFGAALAAGDFDGDGFDDLAVGVPGEDVTSDTIVDAGVIHIFYGSASGGLSSEGSRMISLADPVFGGVNALPGDRFGAALAAGDFDGDGRDDLAVGTPGTLGGGVFVLHGGLEGDFLSHVRVVSAPNSRLEGDVTLTVRLERTGNRVHPLTLRYRDASSSTASAGLDFQFFGGTITWEAGDSSVREFEIVLLEDTLDEPSERIDVDFDLVAGTGVTFDAGASITILDDDVAGTVRFTQPIGSTVAEPAIFIPLTTLVSVVERVGGSASGVTVEWRVEGGTVSMGEDVMSNASGTLTFAAGESSRNIVHVVQPDSIGECEESLRLLIYSPGGGATLGAQVISTSYILASDALFANCFEFGNAEAWSAVSP